MNICWNMLFNSNTLIIFLLGFIRNYSLTGLPSLIFIDVIWMTPLHSSVYVMKLLFFHCLYGKHPSLTFTMDEEKDNKLLFLVVYVERRSFAILTCIYRKPTFTILYLSWDAFAPKSRKVNLIKCITFRVLKICSDNRIKSELKRIKNLFLGNGYPEKVIVDTIKKTVNKFRNNIRPLGPSKCPVYVRFSWIGSPSQLIANKVFSSVTRCYNAARVQTIFIIWATFRSIH